MNNTLYPATLCYECIINLIRDQRLGQLHFSKNSDDERKKEAECYVKLEKNEPGDSVMNLRTAEDKGNQGDSNYENCNLDTNWCGTNFEQKNHKTT